MSVAERLARIDDYLSGHMAGGDAVAFEEELFTAAAASNGDGDGDVDGETAALAADARFVDGIARLAAEMARLGGFEAGGTRAHVDALRAAGLAVHYVDLGAGGAPTVFPAWAAGTQIVVARLGVDLRGDDAVDVEVETADGRRVKTFRDVSCDPTDGALYAICQEPLARIAFGRGRTVSRVIATRAGKRETVAVYDVRPA